MRNAHIIVVEDDADFAAATVEMLRQRKFDVEWAKSTQDAFELIADTTRRVDLVVLDLNLAGERGETLMKRCEALRVMPPPIVITSAEPPEDCAYALLDLGASACLRKPYSAQELLKAVDDALASAA